MYFKLNKKYSTIIGLIYIISSIYIFPFFLILSSSIGEEIYQTRINSSYYSDYLKNSKKTVQKENENLPSSKLNADIDDKKINKHMDTVEYLLDLFRYTPIVFFIFGLLIFFIKKTPIVLMSFLYCFISIILYKFVEQGYFLYSLSNQFGGDYSFIDYMKVIWAYFLDGKRIVMYYYFP